VSLAAVVVANAPSVPPVSNVSPPQHAKRSVTHGYGTNRAMILTYTLFASCGNPPNIPGVRHLLTKKERPNGHNKPADAGFYSYGVVCDCATITVLQRNFPFATRFLF